MVRANKSKSYSYDDIGKPNRPPAKRAEWVLKLSGLFPTRGTDSCANAPRANQLLPERVRRAFTRLLRRHDGRIASWSLP